MDWDQCPVTMTSSALHHVPLPRGTSTLLPCVAPPRPGGLCWCAILWDKRGGAQRPADRRRCGQRVRQLVSGGSRSARQSRDTHTVQVRADPQVGSDMRSSRRPALFHEAVPQERREAMPPRGGGYRGFPWSAAALRVCPLSAPVSPYLPPACPRPVHVRGGVVAAGGRGSVRKWPQKFVRPYISLSRTHNLWSSSRVQRWRGVGRGHPPLGDAPAALYSPAWFRVWRWGLSSILRDTMPKLRASK